MRKPKNEAFCKLQTPFGYENGGWEKTYPRPQMKRDSFFSLCGKWSLSVLKGETKTAVGTILVPYPPESALSGIERALGEGERWLYQKEFTLPEGFAFEGGRVLLHFGAVDQIAEVSLNGAHLCRHEGGYAPFSMDITDALSANNCLQVIVTDELDLSFPYGKQCKNRGGMWYTPTSGIWQSVWLECVPQNAFTALRLTSTLDSVRIETEGGGIKKTATVSLGDETASYDFEGDEITVKIENPHLWTPETPTLYTLTVTDGVDTVTSYFGLRTFGAEKRGEKSYLCLNGEPYFCSGVLDQGYFSDGIFTPKTEEGYAYDILTMKKMGFNMLRKHIKVEPEVFYYLCDSLGMIVFQDMVNSGKYSFFFDTALPTVGLKSRKDKKTLPMQKERFENHLWETAEQLYNHPSVCYYTIFNEGWGQHDTESLYEKAKSLDPSRVWDSASGWFIPKKSDVKSEHIYFRKIKLKADENMPLVLSEFGGYSLATQGHIFNLSKAYGYGKTESKEEFTKALEDLYRYEVIPAIKEAGLCATVLTQLSDVEDEINGLVTYDRAVEKADAAALRQVAKELKEAFASQILS